MVSRRGVTARASGSERETRLGPHVTLVPYGSAEVFWDSRDDAWVRTRYMLGTAVPLEPWFAPEIYYAFQRDEKPSPLVTHALGVVVAFYF